MEGTDLNWRKSSYSGNGGGECVEVGKADRILVRDTQNRTGPMVAFSTAAWERFADQVKRLLAAGSSRRSQGAFSCLMTEGALCRSAEMFWLKGLADPRRHGGSVDLSHADRERALRLTRYVVERHCQWVRAGDGQGAPVVA